MSVEVINFRTEVSSVFAISGVPTRDACQIANVKKALEQDALTRLHHEVEQYLESTSRQGAIDTTIEVELVEREIRAPEFVYREDDSLTRIPGLYEISGVANFDLPVA